MPLFVHQLDLFGASGRRERIADGADLPDDTPTLPPQSAASSALIIDSLLRQLEEVTAVLGDALLTHIYDSEAELAESYHAEVLDDAQALSDTLRAHWPGLRYRHYR